MVTTVGLNSDFNVVLKSLIILEHDAIAAYEASIERFDNAFLKTKLSEFVQDHRRHVQQLNMVAQQLDVDVENTTDLKVALTKGKVIIADMMGDQAILMAMKTNEDDTVTAYERAFNHAELPAIAKPVIEKGFEDERRHRAWITDAIAKYPHFENDTRIAA